MFYAIYTQYCCTRRTDKTAKTALISEKETIELLHTAPKAWKDLSGSKQNEQYKNATSVYDIL